MALWIEDDSNQNKGLRPGDNNNKETKTQQRQLHTESHNTKLSIKLKLNMADTFRNVWIDLSDAFGEAVETLIAHFYPAGDEAPQQQVDEPVAQSDEEDEGAEIIEEGVGEAAETIEEEAGEDVGIMEDVIIPPRVENRRMRIRCNHGRLHRDTQDVICRIPRD